MYWMSMSLSVSPTDSRTLPIPYSGIEPGATIPTRLPLRSRGVLNWSAMSGRTSNTSWTGVELESSAITIGSPCATALKYPSDRPPCTICTRFEARNGMRVAAELAVWIVASNPAARR